MKTATKGNSAEAAILNALVERGFHVLTPFGGGHPYIGVADIFGVFYPATRAVYLVPVSEFSDVGRGRLRIEPAQDNQQRRIRYASEFEIDRWSFEALSRLVPQG